MHHHGYLWVGDRARFDAESVRRPPTRTEPVPTGPPEVVERYRRAVAEFPVCDLPPIEPAYWLLKPRGLVRGTWEEPEEAAEWFGGRLAEYASRFASEHDRDAGRPALRAASAAERLVWGGDVSFGCYLERPLFLSLTVVTCSPNRAAPHLTCPVPGV